MDRNFSCGCDRIILLLNNLFSNDLLYFTFQKSPKLYVARKSGCVLKIFSHLQQTKILSSFLFCLFTGLDLFITERVFFSFLEPTCKSSDVVNAVAKLSKAKHLLMVEDLPG